MAKEFNNDLKHHTVQGDSDNKTGLEEKKADLERLIAEEEGKPIQDPIALENWKKELKRVEKKISEEKAQKAVEQGEIVGENATEKDVDDNVKKEQKEENVDKTDKKSKEEKEKEDSKEEKLKQAYHDAIVVYYQKRLETVERQINENKLISEDRDYEEEIRLELKMYEARDAYLALGKQDPYEEFRENKAFVDRQAHELVNAPLREKARKYREAEEQIAELDKAIAEYDEDIVKTDLSDLQRKEYTEAKDELIAKKNKIEKDKVKYKDASEAFEDQKQRDDRYSSIQKQRREAASFKTNRSYDYQRGKQNVASHNAEVAKKAESKNIEKRIEAREQKKEELIKKLKEPSAMDLRTRLELIKELDKEVNMLEADKEQKELLDKGKDLSEVKMQQITKEAQDKVKEEEKDLEKQTAKIEAVIDRQDENIAVRNVENPLKEEKNEEEIKAKAMVAAAVIDGPGPGPDTVADDYIQYKTACVIQGLDDLVNDPNTPEGAAAIVKNADEIEAQKKLNEIQKEVESQAV